MSREIFDLPPYSEIWKDTKKRTPLSKERELLKTILAYMAAEYLVMTEFEMITQIEDAIKEIQELLAQPEQPEQEPVAWQLVANFITDGDILQYTYSKPRDELYEYYRVTPLYTSPPKPKPLSDEEICEILLKKEWRGFVELVRIIEKARGIGGEE